MTTYTAFIGIWNNGNPTYVGIMVTGLSFDDARNMLAERLSIPPREWAYPAISKLEAASPGNFKAQVGEYDYMILKEPVPEFTSVQGE